MEEDQRKAATNTLASGIARFPEDLARPDDA
jgi:hypothetical protein